MLRIRCIIVSKKKHFFWDSDENCSIVVFKKKSFAFDGPNLHVQGLVLLNGQRPEVDSLNNFKYSDRKIDSVHSIVGEILKNYITICRNWYDSLHVCIPHFFFVGWKWEFRHLRWGHQLRVIQRKM